jgi:hypothetical protein
MTGPEHYKAAEALTQRVAECKALPDATGLARCTCASDIAQAQVHATLAFAAAAAMNNYPNMPIAEANAWLRELRPEVTP